MKRFSTVNERRNEVKFPRTSLSPRDSLTVGAACIFALTLAVEFPSFVAADDLVSLDDPAPVATGVAAPAGAPAVGAPAADSLDSLDGTSAAPAPAAGAPAADQAVDLGGDAKSEADFFNPYTFSRNPTWVVLPLFALILLGLHLMPVPKRKPKNKIDQAKRFFRGISGDGTATGMIKAPPKAHVVDRAPIPDDTTPNPTQLMIKPASGEDK